MSQAEWQKSSFSSGNPDSTCVELSRTSEGDLCLRESEEPGTVLRTTPARLASLLRHLR